MARVSETRTRVREIARTLSDAGQEVSSLKILDILGSGSLSTITDELKKMEAERTASSAYEHPPTAGAIPQQVAPPSPAPAVTAAPPITAENLAEALQAAAAPFLETIEKLYSEVTELRVELSSVRSSNAEQLALAYQRYEAVQRHAMLQIDEARQTAAELRHRLATVTADVEAREDAQRNKMQLLRDENVRLKAKVEVLQGLNVERQG